MAKYASLDQIATLLNVTPRWINRLSKESGFPKEGRGQYDVVKCVHWYIDFLHGEIDKAKAGGGKMIDFTTRKERAIAEMKELELAEKYKTLIRLDDTIHFVEKIFSVTKSKLSQLRKANITKLLIAKDDKAVNKLLEQRDNELLGEISLSVENIIRGLAQSADQNQSAARSVQTKIRRKT